MLKVTLVKIPKFSCQWMVNSLRSRLPRSFLTHMNLCSTADLCVTINRAVWAIDSKMGLETRWLWPKRIIKLLRIYRRQHHMYILESSKLVDWLWFGLCLLYRGERERVAMLLKVSHWTYRNPTQTRRKMENKWRGGREESSSFYFSQPMTAWHTQTHCEKKPMQRNQLRNQRQTTPKQTKQTQRKEERTKTPTKRNQNEQTVTRRHWGTVHKKARSP